MKLCVMFVVIKGLPRDTFVGLCEFFFDNHFIAVVYYAGHDDFFLHHKPSIKPKCHSHIEPPPHL